MAYLDRISGAPVLPEVVDLMRELLAKQSMNPLSPYRQSSTLKQILEQSRQKVAKLIAAEPAEIIFVSNGTESVNLGIFGLVRSAARSSEKRRILISAIEHVSVMNTVRALEKEGYEIVTIPVEVDGKVDKEAYLNALEKDALLVSIQMANPEIGTIQDIRFLAGKAREAKVLFHCDAVDAVGWMPIDVKQLNIDALSFSGTQFGGPPGAAALYLKRGVSLMPMFYGGFQEKHRRPGLENIPAIAGFGLAAEYAAQTLAERMNKARHYQEALWKGLSHIEAVELTGHPTDRIPGHVSLLVRFVEGEALLLMLDMKNIQASSGSSCTAKDLKISPVLTTLGIEHADAQGSLVFSTCHSTSEKDIDLVIQELPGIVERLRSMSPLWKQGS
ncbi:MAG: cysteine desulfurase family protein [bacterium]